MMRESGISVVIRGVRVIGVCVRERRDVSLFPSLSVILFPRYTFSPAKFHWNITLK